MCVISIIILCTLVVVTTGLKDFERYLEAPNLLRVTAVVPEGVFVEWTEVRQMCADPILGYKIRINEVPEYSEFAANVRKDISLQEYNISNTYPATREEIIKENKSKATIYNIQNNVLYEISVLAFKIDVVGPPSQPIRIKILQDTDYKAFVSRTPDQCQISIPSSDIILDETYPCIYNSYF